MKTKHNFKSIEWSYPTSTNANKFGFANDGCYTVEMVDSFGNNLPKAIKGFATLDEAINYANTLPDEYISYCKRFYNL
jgi:hypothetical protein